MSVESCTQAICDLALRFGEDRKSEKAMVHPCVLPSPLLHCFPRRFPQPAAFLFRQSRPFGVALLVAGIDENGPALFHTDPSGTFIQYEAKAIGAGSEGAQSSLQDKYSKVQFVLFLCQIERCPSYLPPEKQKQSMTLKEAEKLALLTLKQVMEEKISAINVEIASVEVGKTFRIYSAQELEAILAQIDDGSSSGSSGSS